MAKTIEVDLQVNSNLEGSIAQLKQLKRELKNAAAGSDDFKRIYNQIDDLEDKIKSAKNTSSDWIDTLENAGGPIGMLGAGLNKAKVATQSFGSALKATGIGLIVIAVGGLVAAFTESEVAMKKLEPLFIGLEKILGGVFKMMEPLLDIFIDLALRALPYVTKAIGIFYSSLFGLFTFVKNAGMGAGQILKGIFTLDWDSLKAGYNQLAGTWDATVKSFKDANKLFTDGSNETTKTEKKNSTTRINIRKSETKAKEKEVSAELKAMRDYQTQYEEHLKKLAELQQQYNTEIEDLQAVTEQQKLDLWYKRKKDEIDAITQSEQEKNALYDLLETQRAIKQAEIEKKKQEDLLKIRQDSEDARTAYEEKQKEDEQRLLDARLQAQLQYASAIGGVVGTIGNLFEQGSAAAKTAALTEIAINTAIGFIQGLDIAQKSAKATGPAAAFAFPIFYATQIGAVLNAAGRAKAILSSGNPSSGGGGGGGSSAPSINAPSFNVVGTNGSNQIAQTISQQNNNPIKAYVVAKDVTTAQSLDRNIVSSASM
jgi:hypothetical protein